MTAVLIGANQWGSFRWTQRTGYTWNNGASENHPPGSAGNSSFLDLRFQIFQQLYD